MADMPPPGPPSVPEVRTRLREAVQMLGESTAVDPAVRGAMGDLLAELGRALDRAGGPAGRGHPLGRWGRPAGGGAPPPTRPRTAGIQPRPVGRAGGPG